MIGHSEGPTSITHRVCAAICACLCSCVLVAPHAWSQTSATQADAQHVMAAVPTSQDSARDRFLSEARAATTRFQDRSAAIADGYRRLGMDFPSMGEHWVNPGIILAGRFEVARPAMLSYVTIGGKPVLAGLVYAIALGPGEAPPAVPGGVGMWHEHNGTVDDESMLPEHRGGGEINDPKQRSTLAPNASTRLAVLHAWTGVANPAGVFAAENWALPFARLGLGTPERIPVGAAHALSLLSGGEEYYIALASAEGSSSDSVSVALDRCAQSAAPIVARARSASEHAGVPAGMLTPADLVQLEDAWDVALSRIRTDVGAPVATRLNGGHPMGIVSRP